MTARIAGFLMFSLTWSVIPLRQSAAAPELPPQATAAGEPSGPKPSETVEKMLEETERLEDVKQPLESLKTAEQSLETAQQLNDAVGAALAQEARARALQDLQRPDEALTVWQEAAQMWAALGDTPGQITALVQAGLLCASNKKSEAERFFEQGLSVGKLQSERPLAVAQALYDSGVALGTHEQEQVAINYLSAALAIREKQTPQSLKLVETLNALAKLTFGHGLNNEDEHDVSLARDYYARAAEIGQRLAPDSPLLVESLYKLGYSEYELSSSDPAAREHYLAALTIQKRIAPGGSMEQARILYRLGVFETDLTNFAAAHQYLEEALAIAERIVPRSPLHDWILENLALLENDEGDPLSARVHLERALEINEELHGNLAPTLMNLGVVALDQYDFAAARECFERALAIFKVTSPNTSGIPFALGNLSLTFYRQGDLASALEYEKRALARDEEKLGDSLATADDLTLMGEIVRDQGEFNAAAGYFNRALEIREKLTPESLHVSDALVDLAKLARAQQNTTLALEYDRRALELGQKSCPNSWCVVGIINDLGELAYEQGDLTSSEGYLQRAVDIREKSLGPMHPDLARSLNNLALTVAAMGRTTDALEMALRAESIGAEHLRTSVRTLSERQSLAYEGIRASGLDLALTLAEDRANTPPARGEVLDAVIRSRALVFDELTARRRSAYGSGDPEVTQLADQLLSARTRLATLVFRSVGDTRSEEYRKLVGDATAEKENAERMLAERSIAFRQDQARTQLGLKEIAASLPQGSALVAFLRYARHDLQKSATRTVALESIPSYAAFVLRAGKNEPEFVQLGGAHGIENLVAKWRRNIAQQGEPLEQPAITDENTYRLVGAALRRRIWDPLVPELGDAREVFVVPDSALHLVSLASLPVGSSQYLIETGPLIHYLSTERDLVPAESRHGEGILVIGNPAFDRTGTVLVASNKQPPPETTTIGKSATLLRGSRSACGTFQSLRFPPLPASQQEAENIAVLWKKSTSGGNGIKRVSAVQPDSGELLQVTGAGASAEAFEQFAPGKRVLHVATHGFFLEGSCESAVQQQLEANKRDEGTLPATAENPLLLSGLAFAGANRRASAKSNETDGILTAEEIAGINLEGVDWAVLSACDTGVGEIKIGEGVFGLRRAFQIAGAKTVIMSLWRVEDETTRQWMGTLYREHFLNGKDTGESVRAASLQILRQRRAKHLSTHPFYWGAFVSAGGWR